MISIHWLLFSDLLSTPVFNKWQMNPYDRSPAFGTFLTLICERPSLVWSWTLYCDSASLFELLCCNKIIILHFFFSSAIGADGLCCQSREFKEWHGCRSTKGVTKGKITSFLCFLSKDPGNPGKIHSSHFFFFFCVREVLLWSGLSRSRAVQSGLVHCPGITGLGYVQYDLNTLVWLYHNFSNNIVFILFLLSLRNG